MIALAAKSQKQKRRCRYRLNEPQPRRRTVVHEQGRREKQPRQRKQEIHHPAYKPRQLQRHTQSEKMRRRLLQQNTHHLQEEKGRRPPRLRPGRGGEAPRSMQQSRLQKGHNHCSNRGKLRSPFQVPFSKEIRRWRGKLHTESLVPPPSPPAGEASRQNLLKRAESRGKLPQRPAGRVEAVGKPVLGQVGHAEDGVDGGVYAEEGKGFSVCEEQPWWEVVEMWRESDLALVIRPEDEVRIFLHVHGEEI